MPRIDPLKISDAPEASRPVLENVKKKFGKAPNIFATLAHSPAALQSLMGQFGALEEGALAGLPHEAVCLLVGEYHGCRYCTAAHTAKAKMAGATEEQTKQFRCGRADDPRTQALLDFSLAVVKNRGQVSDADVGAARKAGLADAELLEAIAIVVVNTFTNYVNALVQTEVDFPKAPELEAKSCCCKECG